MQQERGVNEDDDTLFRAYVAQYGLPSNNLSHVVIPTLPTLPVYAGVRCRRCQSVNLDVCVKQTRSADEGSTVFYTCLSCQCRWRR